MKAKIRENEVHAYIGARIWQVIEIDPPATAMLSQKMAQGGVPDWIICGRHVEPDAIQPPRPPGVPKGALKGTPWMHLATPMPEWFIENLNGEDDATTLAGPDGKILAMSRSRNRGKR